MLSSPFRGAHRGSFSPLYHDESPRANYVRKEKRCCSSTPQRSAGYRRSAPPLGAQLSLKRAAQAALYREKHKAQAGVTYWGPRKATALWGKGGATKRNLKAAYSSFDLSAACDAVRADVGITMPTKQSGLCDAASAVCDAVRSRACPLRTRCARPPLPKGEARKGLHQHPRKVPP